MGRSIQTTVSFTKFSFEEKEVLGLFYVSVYEEIKVSGDGLGMYFASQVSIYYDSYVLFHKY